MFKKVGTKITVAIIFSCIIVGIIEGLLILTNVKNNNKESTEKLISSVTESNTNLVNDKLAKVQIITNSMSSIVESTVTPEELSTKGNEYETTLNPIFKNVVKNNLEDIMGVYLILNPEKTDKLYGCYYEDLECNGNVVEMQKNDISEFSKSNKDLAWYYESIDKKDGLWYEPYTADSGIEMISFVKAIYKEGKYIGLLSVDVNFSKIKEYINSIKLLNSSGYIFVVNEKYDYIIHNKLTSKDNLSTISDNKYAYIADMMKKSTTGVTDCVFGNEQKVLGYSKLNNNWILCAVVPNNILYQQYNRLLIIIIAVIGLGIIIGGAFSAVNAKKLTKSITYSTETLNKISSLNLSLTENEMEFERNCRGNDELCIMIRSIHNLREQLRKIIPDIQNNSKTTLDYSKNLDESIEESSVSIDEISQVMNQLAINSQSQTLNSQNGVKKLDSLAKKIETSITFATKVKTYLATTQEANKVNIENINDLKNKFNTNSEVSNIVTKNVNDLTLKSKNISEILNTIKSIAEQTNLLALNACSCW